MSTGHEDDIDDLLAQVGQAKKRDERNATWTAVHTYPHLAKQLAQKKGDVAKVEKGYETVGKTKQNAWLLSIIRPIGEHLWHYTQIYKERDFRGEATARIFMDQAFTYFREKEIDYIKTLH